MKTTLVLPAHNEEKHIYEIVSRARKYVDTVIVVDDGSRDDTFQKAQGAGAITLRHRTNLGKAGALKTGCEAAVRLGADIIALMDSDGQHKPEDLPRFFDALQKEHLDVIVGSRKGGDKMPTVRRYGNLLLEWASRSLFHVDVQDIQSGFRVFRADVYPQLQWTSRNYHADAEMTVRIGRYKLKYKELYIDTIYLDSYKGMTAIDGLKLLFNIILWRFTI